MVEEHLSSGVLSQRHQLQTSAGTLHSVPLVRTDVSENVSPPSSGFLRVTGIHSCITVASLLISLSSLVYIHPTMHMVQQSV
jgi:hypothetical protein